MCILHADMQYNKFFRDAITSASTDLMLNVAQDQRHRSVVSIPYYGAIQVFSASDVTKEQSSNMTASSIMRHARLH